MHPDAVAANRVFPGSGNCVLRDAVTIASSLRPSSRRARLPCIVCVQIRRPASAACPCPGAKGESYTDTPYFTDAVATGTAARHASDITSNIPVLGMSRCQGRQRSLPCLSPEPFLGPESTAESSTWSASHMAAGLQAMHGTRGIGPVLARRKTNPSKHDMPISFHRLGLKMGSMHHPLFFLSRACLPCSPPSPRSRNPRTAPQTISGPVYDFYPSLYSPSWVLKCRGC